MMKRKYSQEKVEQYMSGRIYRERDDLNIFVRRKSPYSWTMNLGNKWSWIIMCVESVMVVIVLSFIL